MKWTQRFVLWLSKRSKVTWWALVFGQSHRYLECNVSIDVWRSGDSRRKVTARFDLDEFTDEKGVDDAVEKVDGLVSNIMQQVGRRVPHPELLDDNEKRIAKLEEEHRGMRKNLGEQTGEARKWRQRHDAVQTAYDDFRSAVYLPAEEDDDDG